MDARLLSHYALNVDLVWVVLILDQSCLDGLFKPIRIDRQVILWDKYIDIFVITIDAAFELDGFR